MDCVEVVVREWNTWDCHKSGALVLVALDIVDLLSILLHHHPPAAASITPPRSFAPCPTDDTLFPRHTTIGP